MTPTGPIATPGIDGDWDDITRYDAFIRAAADPVGWPMARVRATIAIESAGDPSAVQRNVSNGDSYGLMQIVPYGVGWDGWHELVKEKAGLPDNASRRRVIDALYDPATNIAVGVAILEQFYQQHGSLDAASSAFFTGNPTWAGPGDSVNRNTPAWYRATLNALMAEQARFGDVLERLFGGRVYDISAGYGQLVTWSCPGCYDYQAAYGLDTQHHYAYDVAARAGDGAPLYAPIAGTVVCAGTGVGGGAWGTGCAAFDRLNNYGGSVSGTGHGRLELLHEDGDRSLIIGHVLSSRVRVGDRVAPGDLIGYQGGMNGSHVHLEGRYAGGTRIGDPRVLFPGAEAGGTTPAPAPKADRLPIPQPEEFETSVTVTVVADELPVLQRADESGAVVADPLVKGDTFEAVYQVVGNDGRIYWVSKFSGRVPVEGTTAEGWTPMAAPAPGADSGAVAELVESVRADIDQRLREIIESLSAA